MTLAVVYSLGGPGRDVGALELATIVTQEAICHEVDPELVVRVIARESSFRVRLRGAAGEIGLMQIKRGVTTRGTKLSDRQIERPAENVHLGVRRLALARRRCGGGPADRWIGGYNGERACRRGKYARRLGLQADTT